MKKKIVIFGGSGFIGSTLTRTLLNNDYPVCIVCTNHAKALNNIGQFDNLEIKTIDIFEKEALAELVKDYDVVINLIGKLFEAKKGDFSQFHYEFPKLLSEILSDTQHLIHLSALGIEQSSQTSIYAKSKLQGEQIIIENTKNYNIIKPSIVFGQQDNFFNFFAKMSRFSPFLPLIGGGHTKFEPIYVEDIVKSIMVLIEKNEQYANTLFESYGSETATFKALMQFILEVTKRKRLLLHIPFFIAKIEAYVLNIFKIYLITGDQVELLKYDNISQNQYQNIDTLIGELTSYKKLVPEYLIKK